MAVAAGATAVEVGWRRGIVRDCSRPEIPRDGAYDLKDFLVDKPGMLYKRGGTAFACTTVGASDGVVLLVAVACPEFTTPKVIVIGTDGASTRTLYDITSGSPAAGVALNRQPFENPPTYVDKLILTDGAANLTPKKAYLSGTTVVVADLGGLPPAAAYSCVHLGYLVLANNTTNPNRIWFSPLPNIEGTGFAITAASTGADTFTIAGDHTDLFPVGSTFQVWGSTANDGNYTVTSVAFGGVNTVVGVAVVPSATADGTLGHGWNTTESYIDCAGPISGLASVGGVLLIFTRGGCQRLLGSVPPGVVGENMELQPLGGVGCIDARSIVHANDVVYFAHESGIYVTAGAGFDCLTTKPDGTGISSLWRSYTTDLDPVLGAVVCSGIFSNDWLFTSIRHPAGPDVQFICHLPTRSFVRTSTNIACDMYASRAAPHAELYGVNAATAEPVRALQFKGLFSPTSTNKNDADGTAVAPLWETGAIGDGPGVKHFDLARLSYDMRDAATDNPTLAVTQAVGVEATTYAAVPEGTPLAETADEARARVMLAKESQALSLKFTQSNASSKTEIYAVEADVRRFPLQDGGQ